MLTIRFYRIIFVISCQLAACAAAAGDWGQQSREPVTAPMMTESAEEDLQQAVDAQPPGNQILPEASSANSAAIGKTCKIYLLLPLHGKYASSGQAVHDGFMAAYQANKNEQKIVVTINVIDTSAQGINSAYSQAIANNADLVVGPLEKSDIQTLVKNNTISVPTLALNNISDTAIPNLYQFGLSQNDEAYQVAERASKDGHRRALIIAPSGTWGQGITQSFRANWKAKGGVIVDELAYKNTKALSEEIRQLLHVDKSESRASDLKRVLRQNVHYVPQRRQDVDMIFLVAEPQQARTISPLLKFYYAGNLPVYATSLVYSGHPNNQDHDLDNIQFADMPWVLGGMPSNLQQIHDSVTAHSQTKLYALGVDAFQLTLYLNQVNLMPRHGIKGATGTLYLQDNQHIYRELPWAQIREGQPFVLG